MVKEYKMFQAWKRSEEDENLQLEALFDALDAAGKVTEYNLTEYLGKKYYSGRGYLYPKRDAVRNFLRFRNDYYGEIFWDKMNCYNHSPLDLANQIYGGLCAAVAHEDEGVAFYTCTGARVVVGTVVCMGKMQEGQYIPNPPEGAPRQLLDTITPNDILMFLAKYNAWLKDPLLMFGLWRSYAKDKYGPWIMCLCHHLGNGRREDFYEYGLCAEYDALDYTGEDF